MPVIVLPAPFFFLKAMLAERDDTALQTRSGPKAASCLLPGITLT